MKLAAASLDDTEWYGRLYTSLWLGASFYEILWSFRLQSFISIVLPLFCCPCTWRRWTQQWAKLCLPQLPLQKRKWANTRDTASSPPSAAVNERGCCCQVSCEFETAAERTHCALTTQSGTAAARLPGTTGSIWHTDEFTHDERWRATITHGIQMKPVFERKISSGRIDLW